MYLVFFLYGLGLDLLWLNEIGPHLIMFLLYLFIVDSSHKYLYALSSIKIYVLIIIFQFLLIFCEIIISKILFDINQNLENLIKFVFYILILSYPSFFIFSKIDKIK